MSGDISRTEDNKKQSVDTLAVASSKISQWIQDEGKRKKTYLQTPNFGVVLLVIPSGYGVVL
jgi:hypothetical protein